MIDWRNGLVWVPIVVFALLLLVSFVIGLAGGYKRALYWTGGNLVLWFIAFIIAVAAGGAISTSIAHLIKEKISAEAIQKLSDEDLIKATRMYLGLILYLLVALIGNLIILLPMYFAGYVKWTHIGKYDPRSKKYDKYVAKVATKNKEKATKLRSYQKNLKWSAKTYFWVSRGIAMPASVVLALPMISTMTQVAIGGTVEVSKINTKGSSDSMLKGLYDFTSWITNNIGYTYVSNLGQNTSSILSGVNLGINDDANLQPVFNNIKACLESVQDIGDTVSEADIKLIAEEFQTFGIYVNNHRELLEGWLADVGTNQTLTPIITSVLQTLIATSEGVLTFDKYANLQVFIDGILNGCEINTVENTGGGEGKLKLGQYNFDWYINPEKQEEYGRLAVPQDAYDIIASVLEKVVISKDWIDAHPDAAMDAARAITALFFTNDTSGKDAEPLYLDIIIGPDQILYQNKDNIETYLPTQTEIDDTLISILNEAVSTLQEPAKTTVKTYIADHRAEAIEATKQGLSNCIGLDNQFDSIMDEIKECSSESDIDRWEWGTNKEKPFILPIDVLYTLDIEPLKDDETRSQYIDVQIEYVTPVGEEPPFKITASTEGKKALECKPTGILDGDTPLWWSFVPHFDPIYVIPEFDISINPLSEEQQTYVDTYLDTNWSASGRTNSSLKTGIPETLPNGHVLSDLCSNGKDHEEKNLFELTFNYKSKKTGEEYHYTKYFKLTSFFNYYYPLQV